jgi:ribonuclease P protein component
MNARFAPHAFPKEFRLLRRAQFKRVYDEGQRRSASLCTIFFRSNGLPQTRLGVTAPVRLGNAVFRNRLKRRLREIFRLNRAKVWRKRRIRRSRGKSSNCFPRRRPLRKPHPKLLHNKDRGARIDQILSDQPFAPVAFRLPVSSNLFGIRV